MTTRLASSDPQILQAETMRLAWMHAKGETLGRRDQRGEGLDA